MSSSSLTWQCTLISVVIIRDRPAKDDICGSIRHETVTFYLKVGDACRWQTIGVARRRRFRDTEARAVEVPPNWWDRHVWLYSNGTACRRRC